MVGAFLLIAVGLVFLLSNLGILHWSAWHTLWKLWPLLLIALGFDLMLRKRPVAKLVVGLVLLCATVGGIWWFASKPVKLTTVSLSQDIEGARSAQVSLRPGVARLQLRASHEPGRLLAATLRLAGGEEPKRRFKQEGERAVFSLEQRHGEFGPDLFGSAEPSWEVQLTDQIPLVLKVDTGVGSSDLDLQDLKLTELEVETGVGETSLTLPAHGRLHARIRGGVGRTAVRIPPSMSAQIESSIGLGSLHVNGPFEKRGDTYLSAGYDQAENRVDLRVEGGIGELDIAGASGVVQESALKPEQESEGNQLEKAPPDSCESSRLIPFSPSRGEILGRERVELKSETIKEQVVLSTGTKDCLPKEKDEECQVRVLADAKKTAAGHELEVRVESNQPYIEAVLTVDGKKVEKDFKDLEAVAEFIKLATEDGKKALLVSTVSRTDPKTRKAVLTVSDIHERLRQPGAALRLRWKPAGEVAGAIEQLSGEAERAGLILRRFEPQPNGAVVIEMECPR